MIDAGTVPLKNSIARIIKYLDKYKRVGGASGEIEVFEPTDRELGHGFTPIIDESLIENLNLNRDAKLKKDVRSNKYQQIEGKWYTVSKRTFLQRAEAKCLILAQYVEYKISHYLDKSFESLF